MKTITAIFTIPETGATITAAASFPTLPGVSTATWKGEPGHLAALIARLPAAWGVSKLPKMVFAAQFEQQMQHIAASAGCEIEVHSKGEWKELHE